jgi:hypothetical protein
MERDTGWFVMIYTYNNASGNYDAQDAMPLFVPSSPSDKPTSTDLDPRRRKVAVET